MKFNEVYGICTCYEIQFQLQGLHTYFYCKIYSLFQVVFMVYSHDLIHMCLHQEGVLYNYLAVGQMVSPRKHAVLERLQERGLCQPHVRVSSCRVKISCGDVIFIILGCAPIARKGERSPLHHSHAKHTLLHCQGKASTKPLFPCTTHLP